MRGNPHSYQSIANQMVDPPDYEIDEDTICKANLECPNQAVVQELFGVDLCPEHFDEACYEEAEERKLERHLESRDTNNRRW